MVEHCRVHNTEYTALVIVSTKEAVIRRVVEKERGRYRQTYSPGFYYGKRILSRVQITRF